MKKFFVPIVILLLVLLSLFLVFNSKSTSEIPEEFEFEKIIARDQIPEKIWSGLGGIESLELTRGSYYFLGKDYETDGIYFLLCGGEDYTAGYDVEIVEMKYHVTGTNSNENTPNFKPTKDQVVSGYFEPLIKEIATDSSFEYCKDFKYPFVIFKIKTKISNKDSLARRVPTMENGVYLVNQQNYW